MSINKKAFKEVKITEEDIIKFSNLTGDKNPLHLEENFAKKTRFKKRIAHGMLVASSISSLIADKLPGTGSIYLGQTLKFLNPVYIDDVITTCVEVTKVNKNVYTLECTCTNQEGIVVIKGEAKVLKEANNYK